MSAGVELAGLVRAGTLPFTREACLAVPEAQRRAGVPAALGPGARAVEFGALYDHADPDIEARWITLESADGEYAASLPREDVLEFGWIVYEKDGAPLTPEDGGPFRLVLLDYRDPCANVRDLGRVVFADVPGRDTRPSRRDPDLCNADAQRVEEDA